MHGHSPGFALLVNAEVDSMGGVVDGGVGVDTRTSPCRVAIEKAQAELRQEYDVREERRRELEFLEKGGNPLDFQFGSAASISVQSTSLTDTDQLAEPEAKGSFALATSPHGDSVESSGRPGASLGREPNTADNLLLFDGENSILARERSVIHSRKRSKNTAPSEQSSHLDGSHNAKESEESAIFRLGVKSQAYARRNRSRSSRDSAHVGSTDLAPLIHVNTSSCLPSSRPNTRDLKGLILESQMEDHTVSPICNSKPPSPYGNNITKTLSSDIQLDMELDAVQVFEASTVTIRVGVPDNTMSKKIKDNDCNDQNSEAVAEQDHYGTISISSDLIKNEKETVSKTLASAPCLTTDNTEDTSKFGGVNGLSIIHKHVNNLQNEDLVSGKCVIDTVPEVLTSNNLVTEPSHASASCRIDGNAGSDHYLMSKKADGSSDGDSKEQILVCEGSLIPDSNGAKEANDSGIVNDHPTVSDVCRSVPQNLDSSAVQVKTEEEIGDSRTDTQSEVRLITNVEGVKSNGELAVKAEKKIDKSLGNSSESNNKAVHTQTRIPSCLVPPNLEPSHDALSRRGSMISSELQNFTGNHLKLAKKAHEDAILKEAQIIEAKLKRVGELSVSNFPSEKRRKSHWDFVLEEMAWLSNDFMQERLWKTTAAAQICHWIASTGKLKFEKENLCRKQRKIARTLAKAIMNFWHSADVLRTSGEPNVGTHSECTWKVNGSDAGKGQDRKHLVEENSGQALLLPVQRHAFRFLKFNSSSDHPVLPEAPTTPERIADAGILEMSCEDQFLEESLFYTLPIGAMQVYRESVESDWVHYDEKMGRTIHQEDCEASMCDSVAEFRAEENTFKEDEDETSMYYYPGAFEDSKSSKFAHNRRKFLQPKSYEVGCDLPYGSSLESKLGTHPSLFNGKRPSNNLNVGSIPTKRVRTAARQRVVSPFSAGATGAIQVTSKTDVSSGDTSSFQDDQSSLQGGSQPRKNSEVESTVDFEKQLMFDGPEVSMQSKKKKKPKNLGYKNSLNSSDSGAVIISGKGSSYEQRWQVNSIIQHEQKDHSKRRLESHHFESNGTAGTSGQHAAKKPKLLKQFPDTSSKAITPVTGSIPSPVASQMSNMSNPNKLIKMIANRDRGKKSKALKMASCQSGSESPWSTFEDQALVVLVHDMGPNWELVSDAFNSTLKFKCIFRKPKECKERHNVLIDRNSGDGADSGEDSGSSQPYPSTLPGIPKGSARQLLQRLQGPIEEDALKAHFEKIILIGQRLHFRKSQNDTHELKQTMQVHSSHGLAVSQACPNNLTGGPLTPLDLCEAIASSPDVLAIGYQGPHTNGLAIPSHQGSAAPFLPTSAANSLLQGSPGMVISNGLPSPSASLNPPTRDTPRYGVPRPTSLPVDDQQRMQQYSQMYSGRSIQQSSMSVPGALPAGTDRGVRILPGGNGMGMMCGMNRGMSMPRPGFQGIGSPGMLNMVSSGSMLSSSGVGIPSPVNIHPSAVSGSGNSMLRPRDALQMLRPGQNAEDHRQMMIQELQLQVTQGNGQAIAPFSSMSAPFSNQTVPPPSIQTFPVHQHQQPHQMPQQPHMLGNHHHPHIQGTNHTSPQQQAYAMRLAKERNQHQLQQRLLQQQQQFSGSRAISPLQNSSQIQQPTQSSSSSMTPVSSSQTQHKQGSMPRNPQAGSGLPNQMMKQRQRQQLPQQQQPRHQQQQRQQSQQAKLMKGITKGNMLMHQNMPVDASHVNGLSSAPASQVPEKHLMQQGQGLFSGGSGSNPTLPQPPNQQKIYSRPQAQSLKQMPCHPDTCSQSQVQVPPSHTPPSHTLLASQQPSTSQQQQQQQPQRQITQSHQTIQRKMLHQNHQMSTDNQIQPPADQVQVNQLITTTPIPQCTDSVSAVPMVTSASLSASQWKPDISYDTSTPAPTSHLTSSLQPNLVGTEQVTSHASQGLAQRQFSGSLPIHGHGIGGQWQQQQQHLPPQQQQQQQHLPPQQQQQPPPPSHQQ